MTKKKHGSKGKYKVKLDEDLIFKLASILCTNEEIAAICGCSADTIERRALDIVHKGKMEGRCSLRRKQFERALEGSVPMLIWLGRHCLNQKDEVYVSSTQPEAKTIFGIWNKEGSKSLSHMERQQSLENV